MAWITIEFNSAGQWRISCIDAGLTHAILSALNAWPCSEPLAQSLHSNAASSRFHGNTRPPHKPAFDSGLKSGVGSGLHLSRYI